MGGARRACLVALGIQGVSHMTTQLVVLREMMAVYSGNELVVGVLLSSWLLLMGVGAALGRLGRSPPGPRLLVGVQLALALLPLGSVIALRTLRNVVFVRGAEVGLGETIASSVVLLSPYCLLAGYSLALMARGLEPARGRATMLGAVYVADGAGDTLGGALFGLVLVRLGNHFATLLAVGALCALGAALLAWNFGKSRLVWTGFVLAIGLTAVGSTVDLDGLTLRSLYPGRRVVEHESSPYGDLVVTESAGQYDIMSNGVVVGTAQATERVEETVHFALAQRPRASRVLLVGGAGSGLAEAVLGYPVQALDEVELDPLIIALSQRYAKPSSDHRLRWIQSDGRAFVRQTTSRYDIVMVDLPDPTTLQLNRYYTREFFSETRRVLRSGGVLSLSLGQYAEYVSPELGRLLAITRQTLAGVFAEVKLVPTGRVGILASDFELDLEITERMQRSGIRAQWLTPSVVRAILAPDRVGELDRASRAAAPVNRDFDPVLQSTAQRSWLGRFELGSWPLVAMGGCLALVVALALGRATAAVAAIGFAASGLEVLLLLGLAVAEGAVYGKASLVVTAFMLGSTLGAWGASASGQYSGRRALAAAAMVTGAMALLCPRVLGWAATPEAPSWTTELIFPAMALLIGGFAGSAFVFGVHSDHRGARGSVARLYGADLGGAALGALVTGTLLVPVLGAVGAGTVIGALCWMGVVPIGLHRWARGKSPR